MALIFTPLSTMLWTWFLGIIVPAIGKALVALGVGFVTFTGFQTAFDQLETYIQGSFVGLDPSIVGLVALTRIDDAASMILSAISIKLTLKLAGRTSERVFKLRA